MNHAYLAGQVTGLARLGLKLAALNAMTMLPKAMGKAAPDAYAGSLAALGKATAKRPLPQGALAEEPIHKYVAMMGAPHAAESPTSQWFRNQITGGLQDIRQTVPPPGRVRKGV